MKQASNAAKLAAHIFVAIPANILTIVQSRSDILSFVRFLFFLNQKIYLQMIITHLPPLPNSSVYLQNKTKTLIPSSNFYKFKKKYFIHSHVTIIFYAHAKHTSSL